MDKEEMDDAIAEALDAQGYVDPGFALAMALIDELNARMPGFGDAIAERLEQQALAYEKRGTRGDDNRAMSVRGWAGNIFPR